ncbi:MAG: hypothetical protein JST39_25445 [Bacteroidetes bacterium]|nr:hypothetical protein [Bacteroidota bacterium]
MKKYFLAIATLAVIMVSCGPTHVTVVERATPPPPSAPPPPEPAVITYQDFYDQLAPYGRWIDYPGYGYVFMPNAGPDFKPYASNGHWVYTNQGWFWASDYSWGWATFHYGRWFYADGYGWMWIPGHEWAPAWVSWRRSPDYYGWAPLGPNVSISVSIGGGYNPPPHYWCFVPHQYITHPQINNYYVNENRNTTIINNTTVINNTTIVNNNVTNNHVNNTTVNNTTVNNTVVNNNIHNNYAGGPDPREVEHTVGAPIRPVVLQERNRPGSEQVQNGQLSVYRPRAAANATPAVKNGSPMDNNNNMPSRPMPRHIENLQSLPQQPLKEAKPAANVASIPQSTPANNIPANRPPVNEVRDNNTNSDNAMPIGRPGQEQQAVKPVTMQVNNRPPVNKMNNPNYNHPPVNRTMHPQNTAPQNAPVKVPPPKPKNQQQPNNNKYPGKDKPAGKQEKPKPRKDENNKG